MTHSFTTLPSPQAGPPDAAAPTGDHKRRAVVNGVQKTISKKSMLVNFLATGTLLTFEMVLPSVYGNYCDDQPSFGPLRAFLFLLSLHRQFSWSRWENVLRFCDSQGSGGGVEVPKDERYKIRFNGVVHAIMAVMVFVAIAFSDHRVTNCLFLGHTKEMDEVMISFPLMVGVVCSGLFLVFPTSRSGVGCISA